MSVKSAVAVKSAVVAVVAAIGCTLIGSTAQSGAARHEIVGMAAGSGGHITRCGIRQSCRWT